MQKLSFYSIITLTDHLRNVASLDSIVILSISHHLKYYHEIMKRQTFYFYRTVYDAGKKLGSK